MLIKILLPVFLVVIFLSTPATVKAKVYINELSSYTSDDWVELYADEETDIGGWEIRDNGSYKLVIDEGITIDTQQQFISFDTSNRLNKDGDTVMLFDRDGVRVDEIIYGTDGGICAALENQTIGRYPDGSGSVRRFTKQTRGLANTDTNTPCPTPKPSLAPSPTKAPSPESTYTPEPSVLSIAKTPTLTPKKTSTPKPSNSATAQVKSTKTESPENTEEPEKKDEVENKRPYIAGMLILLSGVFLMGAAGYNYLRVRKRKKVN